MQSAVCDTQVMIVGAPSGDAELTCGGAPMGPIGEEPPGGLVIDANASDGTALGKRYVNEAGDLEVLCTKPGAGSLGSKGETLAVKGAKPLPSSD